MRWVKMRVFVGWACVVRRLKNVKFLTYLEYFESFALGLLRESFENIMKGFGGVKYCHTSTGQVGIGAPPYHEYALLACTDFRQPKIISVNFSMQFSLLGKGRGPGARGPSLELLLTYSPLSLIAAPWSIQQFSAHLSPTTNLMTRTKCHWCLSRQIFSWSLNFWVTAQTPQ